MRLRSQPQVSPEHWSKDFVEHLRTVHFALATVSIALILLMTSKPFNPLHAEKQMREVMNTISTLQSRLEGVAKQTPFFPFGEPPNAYIVHRDGAWYVTTSQHHKVTLHLEEPNVFVCKKAGDHFEHVDIKEFIPTTLGGVSELWAAFPTLTFSNIISIQKGGTHEEDIPDSPRESLTISKAVDKPTDAILLRLVARCDSKEMTIDGEVIGDIATFDVYFFKVVVHGDLPYLQGLAGTDSSKRFSDVFPDLVMASQEYGDDDLAALAKHIQERAAKGDEVFEVLGLKIPSERLTKWGIVVLVAVQLYFIIYLKRLCKKLKPDDPGWDVPWMAMDESWLARVMLAVSVVALPLTASALLLFRAESAWFADGFTWHMLGVLKGLDWSNRVQFVLMPIAVLGSVVLSALAWHYRPRLTEPVAPSQVFE